MNDNYTRDEDKRFTLRINKIVFQLVEQSAKKNKRSIAKEIEFILESYLSDSDHKE